MVGCSDIWPPNVEMLAERRLKGEIELQYYVDYMAGRFGEMMILVPWFFGCCRTWWTVGVDDVQKRF